MLKTDTERNQEGMLEEPTKQTEKAALATTRLQEKCAIAIVALLMSLVSTLFVFHPNVASAQADYKCTGSTYCYALNEWTNGYGYTGAITDMTIVPMVCSGYCTHTMTDHISNYLWVKDVYRCPNDIYGNGCWIQTGERDTFFSTPTPHVATMYYYDIYQLDSQGGHYHRHDLAGVQSGDYGQDAGVDIEETTPTSGVFLVNLCAPSFCNHGYYVNIAIVPVAIDVGEEVEGTVGSASLGHFTYIGNFDSGYNFSYFQDAGFQVQGASAPFGSWTTLPAPGNFGGDFTTHCC